MDETLVHAIVKNLKPGVYYQFWVSAINYLDNEGPTSMVQGYRHARRRNADLDASKGQYNHFIESMRDQLNEKISIEKHNISITFSTSGFHRV